MRQVYQVVKYVKAESIQEAAKNEKDIRPHEIYLSDESRKDLMEQVSKKDGKLHKTRRR